MQDSLGAWLAKAVNVSAEQPDVVVLSLTQTGNECTLFMAIQGGMYMETAWEELRTPWRGTLPGQGSGRVLECVLKDAQADIELGASVYMDLLGGVSFPAITEALVEWCALCSAREVVVQGNQDGRTFGFIRSELQRKLGAPETVETRKRWVNYLAGVEFKEKDIITCPE